MARNQAQMKKLGGGLGQGAAGGLGRVIGSAIFGDTFGGPLGEGAAAYFTGNETGAYMAGRDLGTSLTSGVGGAIQEVIG